MGKRGLEARGYFWGVFVTAEQLAEKVVAA
jgi:hypothetical protein